MPPRKLRQRMFRRTGYRFADKNMRHSITRNGRSCAAPRPCNSRSGGVPPPRTAVRSTTDQSGWSNENRNSRTANDVQRRSPTGIETRTVLRPEAGSSGSFRWRAWSRDHCAGIVRRPRPDASTSARYADKTPTGTRRPFSASAFLEHDPEKRAPVFGKDHAPPIEHDPEKACPGLDPGACPGLDPGWIPVFGKDHAPPIDALSYRSCVALARSARVSQRSAISMK
jgi:hypothetical protein